MKRSFVWWIFIPLFSLALTGCGQTISTLELQTASGAQTPTALEGLTAPLVSPSISQGQKAFERSCDSCHTKDSQNNFKDISAEWLQNSTPKQGFDLITNGLPEKDMPAFSQLSAQDRWNILAYLYTHDVSEEEKRGGGLVYQNLCLSCHGSEGQGDGTLAISRNLTMSDWEMRPLLTTLSDADIFSIIRDGKGNSMNAFAVMLSEDQTRELTRIVRLLSIQQDLGINPQTGTSGTSNLPDILLQSMGFFTVEGNVINVSGGDVKMPAEANLKVFADGQIIKKMSSPLYANGAFRFVFVPYSPEWSYVVSVSHNGTTFTSDFIYGQDTAASETAHLLLKVYDSTPDISVLRGEQTHVMLEFKGDKTVKVVEYVLISNHSSYVVVPPDEKTPLLKFALPANATALDLSNSTDTSYLKTMEGGFGDWQSIEPGSAHQVVFEYQLPFNGDDALLFTFPVASTSVLLMVQDESNQIACKGPLHLNQRKTADSTLDIFSAVNIAAGDQLVLHCYNTNQLLPQVIGGAALLILLVILMLMLIARRRKSQKILLAQLKLRKNQILDAIIVLDDSFKAGDISRQVYLEKRAELVKQLEEEKEM